MGGRYCGGAFEHIRVWWRACCFENRVYMNAFAPRLPVHVLTCSILRTRSSVAPHLTKSNHILPPPSLLLPPSCLFPPQYVSFGGGSGAHVRCVSPKTGPDEIHPVRELLPDLRPLSPTGEGGKGRGGEGREGKGRREDIVMRAGASNSPYTSLWRLTCSNNNCKSSGDCLFTKQYALNFVNSEPRRMDRFALYTRFHERCSEAREGCFFVQRST